MEHNARQSEAHVATPGENESRLMSIIDSAMDAVITVDEAQRVVMFNRAAERIFGVPVNEAMGSPLERFIPERFRRAHAGHVRGFGHTGVSMRSMGRLGTLYGLRADGSEVPIEASISQSVVDGQRLYTVILRDISERKRLEEQFLQAQKMEGIGRLAGGIAHDFNNLLMAIFNYLTLATNRLESQHPARPALDHVQEAATRAATLTRQLLLFARKEVAKPRVISPREIVSGLVPMLRRLIGDDIDLRTNLPESTGSVHADPIQLEQVLMNLVVNARDAMPRGGTLTIQTANVVVDRAADGGPSGPHVEITVTDTGTGMSPETLSHLFEPFFTTKEPGKGTGLGLATCHGIVRQVNGQITVESSRGVGTSVRVLLPRTDEQASAAQARGAAESAGPRGSETVLLAEDSAIVRDLIADALRQAGYTVLAAPGGREALRMAESHLGPIHVLLTDVVMPEMGGVQLASELALRRGGGIRVIYMSGGGEDADAAASQRPTAPSIAHMAKPFSTGSLLGKLRTLLDHGRPA